jgi:hypothetical protein
MNSDLRWRWFNTFREVNRYGKNFTTTHMGILFSLATRANPDGSGIFRGTRGLAEDTGAATETVTAALAKARRLGVIERVTHGRTRSDRADVYRLVDPVRWRLDFTGDPYADAEPPW